jgi:hypothetical protein
MPDASILWMTAPGQNFSLRRADPEAVGGFDEHLARRSPCYQINGDGGWV